MEKFSENQVIFDSGGGGWGWGDIPNPQVVQGSTVNSFGFFLPCRQNKVKSSSIQPMIQITKRATFHVTDYSTYYLCLPEALRNSKVVKMEEVEGTFQLAY